MWSQTPTRKSAALLMQQRVPGKEILVPQSDEWRMPCQRTGFEKRGTHKPANQIDVGYICMSTAGNIL